MGNAASTSRTTTELNSNGNGKVGSVVDDQEGYPHIGLIASNQHLRSLPPELVKRAVRAVALDVSSNRLTILPDAMCSCMHLEKLAIGSNLIANLPENIGRLKRLRWLDATHNRLSELPCSFQELQDLSALGLSDSSFAIFPAAVTQLKNLRRLGFFNNAITTIPASIGNLTLLEKLDLSGNHLNWVPEEVGNLYKLQWLNLSNNRLEHLPKTISRLHLLQELGLCNNKLQDLPDLSQCSRLAVCSVYNNQLTEIATAGLGDCQALTKLDVSCNQISTVPVQIFSLPKLEFLNFRENPISEIQQSARTGRSLRHLDLQNCALASIPMGLISSKQDYTILAAGNPFELHSTPNLTVPPLLSLLLRHCVMTFVSFPEHITCYAVDTMTTCDVCGQPFGWTPSLQTEQRVSSDRIVMAVSLEVCSPQCIQRLKRSASGKN